MYSSILSPDQENHAQSKTIQETQVECGGLLTGAKATLFLCQRLHITSEANPCTQVLVSKNSQWPQKVWEPSTGKEAALRPGFVPSANVHIVNLLCCHLLRCEPTARGDHLPSPRLSAFTPHTKAPTVGAFLSVSPASRPHKGDPFQPRLASDTFRLQASSPSPLRAELVEGVK